MDNIDKTLILSYPRTGSTALLDVYRLYLENTYPNDYLNVPSESMEEDQFFNFNDYKGDKFPFFKFCEKYNFPQIDITNLLMYRESLNKKELGDSIFKAILLEPYFATKIFPRHINHYPDYMINTLLNHIRHGGNLIGLYRRNFLDTISSIITCSWSKQWVVKSDSKNTLITSDMVDIENDIQPIKNIVNGLKIWHNSYLSLCKEHDIKLIAYEDVESFDSNLLFNLHNVKTSFEISPRIKIQHDKEQQKLVAEKYKHLIDQVLTKEVMKDLPLNSSYEVIP